MSKAALLDSFACPPQIRVIFRAYYGAKSVFSFWARVRVRVRARARVKVGIRVGVGVQADV